MISRLRCRAIFGALLLALTLTVPAVAEKVGMDRGSDGLCDGADDMGVPTPQGGVIEMTDIVIEGLSNVIVAGCKFCVKDSLLVDNDPITHGFTWSPLVSSWGTKTFRRLADFEITQEIKDASAPAYPMCWEAAASDFSGALAADFSAGGALGTFDFMPASDDCIPFIIDGPGSGWFTAGFASGDFGGEGETCDPYECVSVEPLMIDTLSPICPLADGEVGTPIDPVTFTATGGSGNYGWSLDNAPAWLQINGTSGELTGTPTAAGGFPFTVVVDDAVPFQSSTTRACSIYVAEPCSYGSEVEHVQNGQCHDPGETLTAHFYVFNLGTCTDTFDLQVFKDLPAWGASIVGPTSAVIDPSDSIMVDVDVTAPSNPLCTEFAEITLMATSRGNRISETDFYLTCVVEISGLDVQLSSTAQSGSPGEALTYCMDVTNIGNCPLPVQIMPSAGWSVSPQSHETAVLQPGETASNICFDHTVDPGASHGETDQLCFQFNRVDPSPGKGGGLDFGDTLCVVSTALDPCTPDFDVMAQGGNPTSGLPGQTVTLKFDVTNNSQTADSYELSLNSAGGWGLNLPGGNTIGPFVGTQTVDVEVSIPGGSTCNTQDVVTLAAQSLECDQSAIEMANGTLTVEIYCAWTTEALGADQNGSPGEDLTYGFRVTNAGNCPATPVVAITSSNGWIYQLDSAPGEIAPGGFADLSVMHTIPQAAQVGDESVLEVCADCDIDPQKNIPGVPCASVTSRVIEEGGCEPNDPVLALGAVQTVSWDGTFWEVQVEMKNTGPGSAIDVVATMDHSVGGLTITDNLCAYGDLADGEKSWGHVSNPTYVFDLSAWPGGSFNAWFDVTYADTCQNRHQVRLDPEFVEPESGDTPGSVPALSFRLGQNVPNPFNPRTTLPFELAEAGQVRLTIYNPAGQAVRTVVDGHMSAGPHSYEWLGNDDSGRPAPSGAYFYVLEADGKSATKRMVLIR